MKEHMHSKTFGDYLLNDKIHETRYSVIYRGRKEQDSQNLIIKILKTHYPTPSDIARFRQGYAQLKHADIDGIIRTIDLIEHDNRFAIVEENFDGIPLRMRIRSRTIDLKSFLNVAGKLAETLTRINEYNIIHLEITPDNILVNENLDRVKITNFGFISEFTHSHDELFNPEFITYSLPYMSPEQTGRMNRITDYRTDFYSVGITWYEILTGGVPFASEDPMELIHAHIARKPVAPELVDPSIPSVVSDIVMKLLSKNPEERYQNGIALVADIDRCRNQLDLGNAIETFPIASQDIPVRFNVPQLLVGRENEVETLLASFDRVTGGKSEMIRVLGHPGIGKSALIHEIRKPIVEKRGYFTSGKYDQFRRDVPYSAIIQAFQGLIRQVIAESEDRIKAWRERLLDALGPNGKVITQVIPEFALIIGEQPDVPELDPEESQNRFNLAFKNFIHVFSKQSHPLTLFIDDAQWADIASLNLIKYVITHSETYYFLLICAYRDNEVSPSSPLSMIFSDISRKGIRVNSIHLEPLISTQINSLIMELFRSDAETSMPLAELLHKKTAGNPFFVIQFLKNMYDNRLLTIDPQTGWTWDLSRIEHMRFTDNVVEFLAGKISSLNTKTQALLKIGACIGNWFDIETLALVSGKTLEEALEDLTASIHEDLIGHKGDVYSFHHDRIQEAAYSLIPDLEKIKLHYKIGHTLIKAIGEDDLGERIFFVVDQINSGLRLVTDTEEKIRFADLNLQAARKAKNSTAYDSALIYLKTGASLLPDDAWSAHYDLTFSLHKEMVECFYINLDFSEAEHMFTIIMNNATSTIDRLNTYSLMVTLYASQANYDQALKLGYEGMRLAGFKLPERASDLNVLVQLIKYRLQFGRKRIEDLIDLPRMTDPSALAFCNLAIITGTVVYYRDSNMFAYISILGASIQMKYGTSEYAHFCFHVVGSILGSSLGLFKYGYRFGNIALKLSEKYASAKNRCRVKLIFAFSIQHWTKHARCNLDYYREAYREGLDAGDLLYSSHCVKMLGETRWMLGHNIDEVLEEYEQYRHFQMESQDPFNQYNFLAMAQVFQCLKGQTDQRGDLDTRDFKATDHIDAYRETHNLLGTYLFSLIQLQLNYLFGQYKKCPDLFLELDELTKDKVYLASLHVPEANFYTSLAIAALYPTLTSRETKRYRRIMGRNQRQMKRWAKNCPENFEHKFLLVEAERARLKGNHKKACILYDRAIRSAGDNEYLQNQAIATERVANLMLELGHTDDARRYMKNAHYGYIRWGATEKARDLEETYPDLFNESGTQTKDNGAELMSTREAGTQTLDLSTLIKAFQTLSSEIDLEKLLVNIMTFSIENAGAQKGCLVLKNETDQQLYVEAWGAVDGDVQVLNGEPLQNHKGLSVSIAHYVARTKKILILNHATAEGDFTLDPYVLEHQTKSIICLPVIRQSTLVGVLYLENNITIGAFTPQHIRVLDLLASQAAISIENARLYDNITRAREHLSHLLETANEGFWQTDSEGNTVDVNPEMCSILGRSRDAIVGHHLDEFLDEKGRENARRQLKILKQYKKCTFEATLNRPDGAALIGQFNATLLHGDDKAGSFAMVTDITKRKRAEAEILKLNQELEQRVFDRTRELNQTLEKVEEVNEALDASVKELIEAKDALWGEMELAKKIQTVLLPQQPEIADYEITGYMKPADEVGGDYYDIINIGGRDWIVIGDVSGHGVSAGLIMMMVQTAIHATLSAQPDLSPSELLTVVNSTICSNISKMGEDKYMTIMVIACKPEGRLCFSGLHQDIQIYRQSAGVIETVKTEGMWIGVTEDISEMLIEDLVVMQPGDTMLLYTDGITEATPKESPALSIEESKQTMFGEDRLIEVFKQLAGRGSVDDIKQGILTAMKDYVTSDDVTFVVVRRTKLSYRND